MTAVIKIQGLTKRFGATVAVDNLSFVVNPGAVVGFLGPNGAGKTTTLRMLLGLVKPSAGTSAINGMQYRDLPDPLRQVGAVLEASSFHPGRTARDHLRLQAVAGDLRASRVDEVLEQVKLSDVADRRVGSFSLGMRQRLGLAAALLGEPSVLILDEPANGLDPEGVHWLRTLLRGLAVEGLTVLVSSHILAEVAQTVDSVVILDRGHLIMQSTIDQLTVGARRIVRVRTPRAEDLAAALVVEGSQVEIVAADRIEIAGSTPERVGILAAERSIPIFESIAEAISLEDVFLQLTTRTQSEEPAR